MTRGQPQPIGDVISQLLARRGYARVRSAGVRHEAWSAAVGEELACRTRATRVRRGVLEVLVENATMVQEMNFQKRALLNRLAELLPEENIRDVKFRVGPVT